MGLVAFNNDLQGGKVYRCQIQKHNVIKKAYWVTAKHSGRPKRAIVRIMRKLKMVVFRNDSHKIYILE